ncbi:CBS domain-containing protein CBSX3, mitochondrial [Arachis stenosperma]|uniref:CBS domain-containing protein CBSX3, mitochondrial n=1 Tax=Arachis stenosperma TaxID=217475 RepID=UPI0025AC421A|nr:CBS domain-containing protein CBSX3, mitochondrial [Arachis stenosperma]
MLRILRALRLGQTPQRASIFQQCHGNGIISPNKLSSGFGCVTSSPPTMQLKGLENVTVSEVLMTKGQEKIGSWLSCQVDDAVINAMKNMAENNIGSLVVLKSEGHLAGIVTERDCLKKIVAQGRSPYHTQVGEIMTNEQNLITVTSDMNILQAVRLMTENSIRHVPVIDGKIVGMISIVDVVRAVMEQQNGELKRLNDYIKGEYY